MTVPPTFGWEDIASVLALVSVLALAFLLVGVLASSTGRTDWQGYLGTRSGRHGAGSDDAGTWEDDVPVAG